MDALQSTKWRLWLYPMGSEDEHQVGFFLFREKNCNGPNIIQVNYQLAFLDKDGLLFEEEIQSDSFKNDDSWGYKNFVTWQKMFITEKEAVLPEDTLTVQCAIWNKEDKPIKPRHLYAQTVFNTNRRSLVWSIDKFSNRKFASRNNLKDGLVDFDLVLNDKVGIEKEIVIIMNSFDEEMKYFSFKTSIIDSEGRKENCGMTKYLADDLKKGALSFMLDLPRKLMEDKSLYLPNDILCLNCEFVFTTETVLMNSFGSGIIPTELKIEAVGKEKSQNTTVLIDDLKSMYNDGIFSDMELRTSTQTFPVFTRIY